MDIPLYISLPLILLLTLISGVFSASETAFVAASKATLHRLSKKGDKKAKLVVKLRGNLERLVSAILLNNIMVNTLATAISTLVFVELFGDAGVIYASAVMTVLIVTYAEVMPKVYAINHAISLSRKLAAFMDWVVSLSHPITLIMDWVARKTLLLFGIRISSQATSINTVEELRGAIDLHISPDEETAAERAMLHSILDLGDVEVSEIMTHRKHVLMLDASLPIQEILEQVIDCPYTRIPLYQDNPDNIVGILHAKGFLRALSKHEGKLQTLNVIEIASKPWFIPESTTLHEQLQAFRTRKEHFAIVVDEYGSFEGIVTLEDIIEEIVGEISDEHDIPLDGVWIRKDGTITAVGTTTIRDLNRKFEWALPDEEASTIAGLILHESRIIPEPGQTFRVHDFDVKILKRVRNQITLVSLKPAPKEASPDHA